MKKEITFKSYDGVKLVADYYEAKNSTMGALCAHGITSEKTEAGFYTNMALQLNDLGMTVLSLDLRSHGDSEGNQEDFFLSGGINDISTGIDTLLSMGVEKVILIAASFSGGLAIRVAEIKQDAVTHLILLNPRLNYSPWINDPMFWGNNTLTEQAQRSLNETGYIVRKGFKLGKPMVNELISFDPTVGLQMLDKPILYVHGTDDTVVPIDTTIENYNKNGKGELIKVSGAQHGFTDPITDDPSSSKSQDIRRYVIEKVIAWIKKNVSVSS